MQDRADPHARVRGPSRRSAGSGARCLTGRGRRRCSRCARYYRRHLTGVPARGRLDDASHQRAADVAPPSIDGPFHAGIPRRAQARWQRRRYCPNELRVAHFAVHGTARGWRQDSTIDQFLAACPVNLALTGVL